MREVALFREGSMKKRSIVAIIGPTAVGKTEASLELAQRLGCEIVSVDSRQVYRYLDIGTDKVSLEVRKVIPHHLIDVVDPDQIFSAADFVSLAGSAIEDIRSRGRYPLLVGGTPFYYKALIDGILTSQLPKDLKLREELEGRAKKEGRPSLHEELARIDPETASKLHPNDLRRVTRALEIYLLTGRTASWWRKEGRSMGGLYDVLYLGLYRPREDLYSRIESRIKRQFASGFVEEVAYLLSKGYGEELPAMQGFGYRELVAYHKGHITLEEAARLDAKSTKAFARRQMTWFKNFSHVIWYDISCISNRALLSDMEGHMRRAFEGWIL